MSQDSLNSGGCTKCGPYEVCGHAREICPKVIPQHEELIEREKTLPATIYSLDPESYVLEHSGKDPNFVDVNEAGTSKGGILKTGGMVPCTSIFLRDRTTNIGALAHFQPYSIRQQDFNGRTPNQVATDEMDSLLSRMKALGANLKSITALTLRSNVSHTNRHEANWSSVLVDAMKTHGIQGALDEIHEGDVKEAYFDVGSGKITVSFYKRGKADKEFAI